jgi:hypothetical protein
MKRRKEAARIAVVCIYEEYIKRCEAIKQILDMNNAGVLKIETPSGISYHYQFNNQDNAGDEEKK